MGYLLRLMLIQCKLKFNLDVERREEQIMKLTIITYLCVIPFILEANQGCIGNFELINKMIVVEAEVNGLEGYFIIDTGSPDLILNSQHFDGEKSNYQARGIDGTGTADVHTKLLHRFQWGCAEKKNFPAYLVNLQYLEQAIDRPLLGLIGFEILKEKELLFDYRSQQIEQHPIRKSDLHRLDEPSQEIEFRMSLHQLVLEVKLGDRQVQVILDTASEDNLLENDAFASHYVIKDTRILIGAGQQQSLVKVVTIPALALTDLTLEDQEYLLTNMQHLDAEGILGFPALNELSRFSINYRKKRIYVW